MAISYIASDTQTSASALSLTFSIPATAQAGDFMIVFVAESANLAAQWWDDDGGGGNGWTLAAWERSQVGQDLESALYYKVHSGTESDPTFTWMTSGTSQPMSGIMLVYRGVDTVTPVADITHMHDDNDNNPPNSPVRVDNPNSWVVCFNALTHDDTAIPTPPSGFTMRAQVYGGASQHTEDNRDRFAADISGINTQLRYETPAWLHGVAANISEYHCYTISLNEIHSISISDYDKRFHWGDTNLTITGYGFGATQGTGKVEIWSDFTGTTKVSQTVDSWSDTSIQIDTVQGSLGTDQYLYLVATNDSGEESIRVIYAGFFDYIGEVSHLEPDHWWPLNNNYEDYGRRECYRPMIQSPLGTINLTSGAICNDIGYTLSFGTTTSRIEAPDSRYVNVYSTLTERTFAGWIQVSGVDNALSIIYKEGGTVQNLLLATGMGNVLIAQLADTGDIVHSIADERLTLDRPYHVCIRFSYLEDPKEMRLYVDGRVQSSDLTSGNPLNGTAFDDHSVDIVWGDPDTFLQTGGTSIGYDTRTDAQSAGWVTFSNLDRAKGALDPETEILDVLFRRGALPKYTISSDTAANMQTDITTQLQNTEVEDWPLGIRVEAPTDGDDLSLNLDNITFNSRTSDHLEWQGSGTLTLYLLNGAVIDPDKVFASRLGTVQIITAVTFTVTVLDIEDESVVVGARVYLWDDSQNAILSGVTDVNGEISTTVELTGDLDVIGRVRSASGTTKYKTSNLTGTITTEEGLDTTIYLIKDQ